MSRVRVAPCELGLGLFASEAIATGENILRLEGPEITLAQVRAKGTLAANALQIGIERYLDLQAPGRYVNHSCSPNAGIRDDVWLIALEKIAPGAEIRFDYSTTISDGWTMPCRCGSTECRSLVGPFLLLPLRLRMSYSILQIVQGFIIDGLNA